MSSEYSLLQSTRNDEDSWLPGQLRRGRQRSVSLERNISEREISGLQADPFYVDARERYVPRRRHRSLSVIPDSMPASPVQRPENSTASQQSSRISRTLSGSQRSRSRSSAASSDDITVARPRHQRPALDDVQSHDYEQKSATSQADNDHDEEIQTERADQVRQAGHCDKGEPRRSSIELNSDGDDLDQTAGWHAMQPQTRGARWYERFDNRAVSFAEDGSSPVAESRASSAKSLPTTAC